MNRLSKILIAVIICISTANAILAFRYIQARQELQAELQGPTSVPRLSGFTLDGTHWSAPDAPCYLLRMTADACPHCKADQVWYGQLLDSTREKRCEIIELSPRYGDMALKTDRGVVQLGHVDVDLGKGVLPFVTPHTILMDGEWSVVWHLRGELRSESVRQATRILAAIQDNAVRAAVPPPRFASGEQ